MTDDEATDPAMWARQIRATVKFADELDLILDNPFRVLVEVGPGGTLTGSAVRHPKWSDWTPRRSSHASPGAEPERPGHVPAGARANCGPQVSRSTGHLCPRVSRGGCRCLAIPLHGRSIGLSRGGQRAGWTIAVRPLPPTRLRTGLRLMRSRARPGSRRSRRRCNASARNASGCHRSGCNDNFFDIGGDSLLAIGVAMSATNQGLELTPQDLYDHPERVEPGGGRSSLDTPKAAWPPCRPVTT